MIAYLSGAIENAPREGKEWRCEITEWLKYNLNHRVIDPVLMSRGTAIKENAVEYRLLKSSKPEKSYFWGLCQKLKKKRRSRYFEITRYSEKY